jgi:hypothetical protein
MSANIRTLQEGLDEFHRLYDLALEARSSRLRAAQILLELQNRVKAGEAGDVTWWKWFGQNSNRSRKDAEKLLKIARAPDPKAAAAHAKAKNAGEAKKSRDKKKDPADISGSLSDEELWQRDLSQRAGDAIAMRASWSKHIPAWETFVGPTDLVTLVRQAAAAWGELAEKLEAGISSPTTAPEAPADAPAPVTGTPPWPARRANAAHGLR